MKNTIFLILLGCAALFPWHQTRADGPADNKPDSVRPVPPLGQPLEESVRLRLAEGTKRLRQGLQQASQQDPSREPLLPEIEALVRAVELAVEGNTFYNSADVKRADQMLLRAADRLALLGDGATRLQLLGINEASEKPLLTGGGFRSRLDQSVQPYGLVIPANWKPEDKQPKRLDVWLHGRGENQLELQFLDQRFNQVGQVAPEDTFVLHPFGRYCNAFKFAGEIDILEAIEHVKRHFPIDPKLVSIRGFSMGGAGCWQMAVHYPDQWFAATPGAGFSETTEFLRVFQNEVIAPSDIQKQLLRWYDCTHWANNLRLLPTIAYSGELDRQKQAADMMEAAFAERGMTLRHVIGPQTAHKIHPESLVEIETFLAQQARSRSRKMPIKIDLTTFTLRYAENAWLRIEGMKQHWTEARVLAELVGENTLRIKTSGITRLSINFSAGECPLTGPVEIDIDGELSQGPAVADDGSLQFGLTFEEGSWWIMDGEDKSLRKRPKLQGPIDDAFMDSFVFVRPSKPCTHGVVERWTTDESKRAMQEWQRHFRGESRSVLDQDLTDANIRDSNLILFGDPFANLFLAKIIGQLPVTWTKETLRVGDQTFDPVNHAIVMVYPNPLNPDRYVVLNSGFTYREYAYLNNARQVPMLPDWAVLNAEAGTTNYQVPGKIVAEGFFDEKWKLKP